MAQEYKGKPVFKGIALGPVTVLKKQDVQVKRENKMRSLISGGTTVLYVSHSIESIKSLCDKVVWLEHGKVIQVGTAEKVCAAYYESQIGK